MKFLGLLGKSNLVLRGDTLNLMQVYLIKNSINFENLINFKFTLQKYKKRIPF